MSKQTSDALLELKILIGQVAARSTKAGETIEQYRETLRTMAERHGGK